MRSLVILIFIENIYLVESDYKLSPIWNFVIHYHRIIIKCIQLIVYQVSTNRYFITAHDERIFSQTKTKLFI